MKDIIINIKMYFTTLWSLCLMRIVVKLRKYFTDKRKYALYNKTIELANKYIENRIFTDLAVKLYIVALALKHNTTEKNIRYNMGCMIKDDITK